jgi:hypothetical protein
MFHMHHSKDSYVYDKIVWGFAKISLVPLSYNMLSGKKKSLRATAP